MSITLKKILLLCGCLILVGGVAFNFIQQNKPDPDPVVEIYNATETLTKAGSLCENISYSVLPHLK